MREIKAGLGLVFGTMIGWLYFFLILSAWISVIFLSSFIDIRESPKNGLVFWFFYMLLWPVSIGASQLAAGFRSVLSCGGLYCVPRLTKGMKRFSIIAGFVLAFMFTLPLFLARWPQELERYAGAVICFTLLSAGFLGRSIPPPTGRKRIVSLILWVAIFIRILCGFFLNIHFLEGWPAMLAAGIFLCVLYCGPDTNRRIQIAHRQLAGSTTDINERPQQAKMRIAPEVERFFINRLTRCSQKCKYLWGAVYLCLGILLSSGKRTLSIALCLLLLFGFLPSSSHTIIVFIMIMVILSGEQNIKLPVHSQMLVSGGRRERYYGTIAAAIGFSIAIGLMFVLIASVSRLIALLVPPFIVKGQTVTFAPLSFYSAYIAIGMFPVVFGLALCLERAPLLTGFVAVLIAIPTLFFAFSQEITGLTPITLIVISCWAFLILVSRSICYCKDLILQTDKI